jgi:hypothetical protein
MKRHALQRSIWIGIIWSMLPFTLASGMPRLGCVCANGQYRLFCARLFRTPAIANPAARSAGCCCCRKSGSDSQSHSAARVAGKGCCKPIVAATVLPSAPERVAAPAVCQWSAARVCDRRPWVVNPYRDCEAHRARLPVPDLVIAHQVLVI